MLFYATIARRNMRCLVTAGKYNDIRAIARHPPITIQGLLEVVFSVGSAPRIYRERTPGGLSEFSCGIFAGQ
jgi:hypothetical protein